MGALGTQLDGAACFMLVVAGTIFLAVAGRGVMRRRRLI